MKRRGLIFAVLIIVGFLFGKISAIMAVDNNIMINEIGGYEATDYEWVEIYNKGNESVDISGWKFWESSTNHGLSVSTTDSVLDPGEYAAICQNADNFIAAHPIFSGSVFDSAWGSLSKNGEEIGLKFGTGDGDFVEKFTYPAFVNYSLEKNSHDLDPTDPLSWHENLTGNTVGVPNSVVEVVSSTPLTTEIATATDYSFWQNIKLNEVVAAPSDGENEKVELYNLASTTYDLSGGYVCDNHATSTYCKPVTGVIADGAYLVVDLGTRSLLNNDADSVILKNPVGEVIDQVNYSGASAPANGESLSRIADGSGSWQVSTNVTLGFANVIVARPAPMPAVRNVGSSGGNNYTAGSVSAPATTTVIINEIYPDPAGSDNEDEFIEIYNFGNVAVDLGGWKIKDNEKSFDLSANIPAGGYLVLKRPDTGIALNNTTAESVVLVDAWAREVDKISYEQAITAESYNRTAGGWQWSSALTPGKVNVIEEPDAVGVIWKILVPDSGEPNENLKFSALGSVDPRGGQLNFVWKFASDTFYGAEIQQTFVTSGIFEYEVMATSTAGTSAAKKLTIKIGSGLSVQNANVGITEIFPNPDGSDDNEYIEVGNFGSSTVSLANWILKVDTKQYEIPVGTNISPDSSLVFYRLATKMALNNSGGKVSLLTPSGDLVDFVKYDKAMSGKSYGLANNVWSWGAPSPGTPPAPSYKEGDKVVVSPITPPLGGGGKGVVVAGTTKYKSSAITTARSSAKDTALNVSGVVTVLPGVFGTQYFYIQDDFNGLQVYQNKKDFPVLALGDEIKVSGLTSEASGQKRIRAGKAGDIVILQHGNTTTPQQVAIEELDEELLGRLIKVNGDITEIKSGYFYVDNGAGEVRVTLKSGTGIDKKLFNEGDSVSVTGILENGSGGMEIWPRFQGDITVTGVAPEVAGIKISSGRDSRDYVIMILGMVCAVMGGYLAREKLAKI